jgi:hypothetical protein
MTLNNRTYLTHNAQCEPTGCNKTAFMFVNGFETDKMGAYTEEDDLSERRKAAQDTLAMRRS